ncbi:Pol polyprotein (Fragment) [Linum perenne]
MQTPPPKTVRDVKTLTGRLAAMNRFIPKSAERQAPFFAILKAAAKFSWTEECSKAFEELKAFLTTPPTLAAPIPGDELYLYSLTRITCPPPLSSR